MIICICETEKIAALVNRRKSSEHIADEEINAIQHELFVQFEQWRNQTDAGKLLIQVRQYAASSQNDFAHCMF